MDNDYKSPLTQQEPKKRNRVRLPLAQKSLVAGWRKSNWEAHTLRLHQRRLEMEFSDTTWKSLLKC